MANVYSLLLDDEERVLLKTRKIREQIIDEVTKDGVPTNSRDIRVINEVMNALDTQVLGLVDKRLKHEENQNTENLQELVKELVINIHRKRSSLSESNDIINPDLSDNYMPDDVVPGEMDMEYKPVNPEEIIGEEL